MKTKFLCTIILSLLTLSNAWSVPNFDKLKEVLSTPQATKITKGSKVAALTVPFFRDSYRLSVSAILLNESEKCSAGFSLAYDSPFDRPDDQGVFHTVYGTSFSAGKGNCTSEAAQDLEKIGGLNDIMEFLNSAHVYDEYKKYFIRSLEVSVEDASNKSLTLTFEKYISGRTFEMCTGVVDLKASANSVEYTFKKTVCRPSTRSDES